MSLSRSSRGACAGLAAACLAAAVAGCGVVKSLLGTNTIDLEDAEIQAMRIDLREPHSRVPQKTICPREQVQVAVHLQAKLEGESESRWFETWEGRQDADKNGKLEFDEFRLQTDFGKIDAAGWLTPTPDLLATVDKEITLSAAYRADPAKFKATASYRPDYDCITAGGGRGMPGALGKPGRPGNAGVAASRTQTGGDGNIGIAGERGGDGSAGPELRAYATFVKTPFYERLVAVRIEGPITDFLLSPPGKVVTVKAVGGPGGPGGKGGDGGPGGRGGDGDPSAGDGGKGGDGANGGPGGHGGPGGAVELVYDERFPELAKLVRLDASGGAGGEGGRAGQSGRGGDGGAPARGETANSVPAAAGERGADGSPGKPGAPGKAGPDGTSAAGAGQVGDHFRGLRGITPL